MMELATGDGISSEAGRMRVEVRGTRGDEWNERENEDKE